MRDPGTPHRQCSLDRRSAAGFTSAGMVCRLTGHEQDQRASCLAVRPVVVKFAICSGEFDLEPETANPDDEIENQASAHYASC